MSRKRPTLAIAYDFDGTLAPGNMQEHQFLPDLGVTAKDFWAEVKAIAKANQADEVLVYMNLMLKKAADRDVPVKRESFKDRGKQIPLFEGVDSWFDRVDAYAKSRSVDLRHFLISSGNAEIFEGTKIAKKFDAIYASKYLFDANGVAKWPALAINYTTKTQYLFRINKGVVDISDNRSVNEFVPKEKRPIPFENIIFIGDGASDVPCFRLVKEQGGLSVAVYTPKKHGARDEAERYRSEGRVHAVAPAIYSEDSDLDKIVRGFIDVVSARATLLAAISSS